MKEMRFEYKISLAYLLIGGLWILFSDQILFYFTADSTLLTTFQTYKGWFYVLSTALLFYIFLKKHLSKLRSTELELEKHKNHLEELVLDKTRSLDAAISKLSTINEELQEKSTLIEQQNSELQRALQELKETQGQLLHADKMASLGIMTAGIAHEINNPLNYISGGITGLESYLSKEELDNEKIILFIDSIKTGIIRVGSIVSGLNQMSRNVETYDEKCDIHSIIENCLLILNSQIKNRIEIVKNYSELAPVTNGNVGQLYQAFSNILLNACQAIENRGTLTISTELYENNILVKVTDSGCGIPEENLSKITDPFFTTKEPGMGTGLGLSIAYNLIQAHNGKLSFESEVNKGTIVTVQLPVIPQQL